MHLTFTFRLFDVKTFVFWDTTCIPTCSMFLYPFPTPLRSLHIMERALGGKAKILLSNLFEDFSRLGTHILTALNQHGAFCTDDHS